jgi:hypothetical protein
MPKIDPRAYDRFVKRTGVDVFVANFLGWRIYKTMGTPTLYYATYTAPDVMFGKLVKLIPQTSIGKIKARIVQITDDMTASMANAYDKKIALEAFLRNFHDSGETDTVELNTDQTIAELFGSYNFAPRVPRVQLLPGPELSYREAGPRTMVPAAYMDKIRESEEALLARPNMSARMLDENANVVFDKTGDSAKRIRYSPMDRGILDFYKDNGVFMHTHHGTYDPLEGFSFTITDLQRAIANNLVEFRVVTHHGTYVLLRPENGWDADPQDVHRVYTGIKYKLQPEFDRELRAISEDMRGSQVKASAWDITYRKYVHEIMRQLSKKFGFQYYYVPRTPQRRTLIDGL